MVNRIAVEIDVVKLWQAIRLRLFRTDKTARDVAAALGFSPQVFSDIKAAAAGRNTRGDRNRPYQPGGNIYLTICWWLGADPREFQRVRPDAIPAERLHQQLAGRP